MFVLTMLLLDYEVLDLVDDVTVAKKEGGTCTCLCRSSCLMNKSLCQSWQRARH